MLDKGDATRLFSAFLKSVRMVRLVGVACLLVASLLSFGAHAGGDQATALQRKATSAFSLGHYDDAAQYFEKAFELTPEPALLYNAAQSHRLAGNKERALTLYQNYLRVYGKAKHPEVTSRIEELEKAIARDKAEAAKAAEDEKAAAAASRPASPARAPLPSAPPPQAESSAPVLVSQPADNSDSADEGSLTSHAWFWVVVGGGVAAAAAVAIVLATRGAKDPMASLGTADGN